MIPIENEKRIDWNAIKTEYLTGNISQRKLAEKYGVSFPTLRDRAKREKWLQRVDAERDKIVDRTLQKTADAVADNAVIAERLKKKILLRLERIEEKYPLDATEVRMRKGDSTAIYRIKDITGAFRDITGDMQMGGDAANELLQSLIDLERRMA